MIKVIFFDIDGTLVSHTNHHVPESTKKALHTLKNKGIMRVIATGRHIAELAELPINDIEFDGYITLNGQLCLDRQKKTIYANPIPDEDKSILVDLFAQKHIPIMLLEQDRMYINFINQAVKDAQNAISTSIPSLGEYTGNELYQVIAYVEKNEEEMLQKLLKNCKITRWNTYGVDIVSQGISKVVGVEQYLTRKNMTKEDAMAFGDAENDIEMLKYVGTGIAMGNAEDLVKKNADYITAHIDNDGIEKALQHFKLIV